MKKTITSMFSMLALMIVGNVYAQCTSSHPVEACGQCWEDCAQATSGGCTDCNDGGDGSGGDGGDGNTTQISYSTFEGGWNQWIDGGGDCIRNTENPSGGLYAINLRDNSGNASATWSPSYDLSSYESAIVEFDYIAVSFESGEDFWISFSTNGGQSFTKHTIWTEDGSNDIIENAVQSITITYDNPGSQFAVKFRCDASGDGDDVYIDNVRISGSGSSGGSPTPSCSDGIQNGDETGVDCGGSCPNDCPTNPGNGNLAKLEPPTGQTLLIVGQDLLSVSNYQSNCGNCPTMGGVTTYVSFYDILNNGALNGALGINSSDQINSDDLDWGGGPLNGYSAAVGFPNSTLQIGLNIAEGNNGGLWCAGCLANLANGGFQAEIQQLADFLNMIGDVAVFLRVGYEFDGTWNDGYSNTNNYINAYRNIVDGLRAAGVDNVAYVWQASSSPIDDIIEGGSEDYMNWYPGDNYVDWTGISWFLLPNETPPVGGFSNTQLSQANQMASISRSLGKPLMIAESTPQGYDIGGTSNSNISPVWDGNSGGNTVSKSASQIWSEWFDPYFQWVYDNSDIVKAVSYINANWNAQGLWASPYSQGYWGDTRIEANNTIENNWVNEISSSFWLHGSSSLNSTLLNNGSARMTDDAEEESSKTIAQGYFIYPNSVSDVLYINGADRYFSYNIIDQSGRTLLKGNGTNVNVNGLKSGIYYLKHEGITLRFIKK